MKKSKDYLLGILFTLVGIVFLVIVFFINKSEDDFKKMAIKTTGVIHDINYKYDNLDNTDETIVIISFKDKNGVEHEARSNTYSSDMRIGKEIVVYYDENNPTKIVVEKSNIFNYILYGLPIIFVIVGIVIIIKKISKSTNGKKLMETGIKVMANISDVSLNTGYVVNGRSPYVVRVGFIYQDIMYEAKTENLWFDVPNILNTFFIKSLPVYFEQENPKNNYVDTSELEKYVK